MNFPLIKTIVKSFFDQHDIKNQDIEEVSHEILNFLRDLRENEIEIYHEYQDQPLLIQTNILTDYLYSIYFEDKILEDLEKQSALLEIDRPLEFIDEGVLSSIAGGIFSKAFLTGVLVYIVTLLMSKKLSKLHFSIIARIGELLETISKKLLTSGRYWKFRYQIVQKNSAKCYRSCGIDPNDISPLTYWHVYINTKMPIYTEKSVEQARCLTRCYVAHFIYLIQIYLEQYFTCLKNTGEFDSIKNAKLSDIMKIVSSTDISSSCSDFYKVLRGKLDLFDDLLNFVTSGNNVLKQKYVSMLLQSIDRARKNVSNQKQPPR